jgi:hypothetical protein
VSELLPQAIELTNKDFSLSIPQAEVQGVDEFHTLLKKVIGHLLDTDFERLMNGLYRIDVDEHKVKLALASNADVAGEIATLIIQREIQKIETRQKYKS